VLDEMLKQIEGSARSAPDAEALKAWWKQIDEWRRQGLPQATNREHEIIKPQFVVAEALRGHQGRGHHHLRRRPAPDVGGAVLQVRQAAPLDQLGRPRHHGRRPAYAMGVQLAHPGRTVACVTGEGSIQMCIQELSTCKQYRLPIKIVNLNNRYLGMVRQWQELFHGNRYSESYMDSLPDFVKLAEAYGHVGMRIDKPGDVEGALKEAFTTHKDDLVFLDFHRPDRERLPDGAGRQGPHRDDPGRRPVTPCVTSFPS
jgi:acetolactate synthase-1/2/3 large subunit